MELRWDLFCADFILPVFLWHIEEQLLNDSTISSGSYSVFIRCCLLRRDGRIHSISSAIACITSLHFVRLKTFFFELIFSVSSSTCFFFNRPRFLLPLASRSRATLKTLSSSLLSTCPYHLTPFGVANRSIVSFNPSISFCSSVFFLSTSFRSHMALTIAFLVLLEIAFSFSSKHYVSLRYSITDLMQQR